MANPDAQLMTDQDMQLAVDVVDSLQLAAGEADAEASAAAFFGLRYLSQLAITRAEATDIPFTHGDANMIAEATERDYNLTLRATRMLARGENELLRQWCLASGDEREKLGESLADCLEHAAFANIFRGRDNIVAIVDLMGQWLTFSSIAAGLKDIASLRVVGQLPDVGRSSTATVDFSSFEDSSRALAYLIVSEHGVDPTVFGDVARLAHLEAPVDEQG